MAKFVYRPWGRPSWLLKNSGKTEWIAVACLGTEKRSVDSMVQLAPYCNKIHALEIVDPLVFDIKEKASIVEQNFQFISNNTACPIERNKHHLKASLDEIEAICNGLVLESQNIVLDITAFPKRWFFPIIRELIQNERVTNLHVVYTKGSDYATILSENPETLRVIHGFPSIDGRTEHDFAFVGVGFHTQSMISMFGSDNAKSLQMLFPFPPGPPSTQKNWRFVQQVERIIQRDENLDEQFDPIKYIHTDANDISQVFDIMRMKTDNGLKTSMMAPYGPKTFSLAMCLFAIAADEKGRADIPIFYAQPQRYATDYTKSTSLVGGQPDTWSYALKHEGKVLYAFE